MDITFVDFLGTGTYEDEDSKCTEGRFKQDVKGNTYRHGVCKFTYPDGTIREADYNMNYLDGETYVKWAHKDWGWE